MSNSGFRAHAYDLGEDWKMHYTDERLKPLREELLDVMRFWLNKGVDGFRVDMANSLVKGWQLLIATEKKFCLITV